MWLAEVGVAVVLWIGLPMVARTGGAEQTGPIPLIFYVLGLSDIGIGWWLRGRGLAAARQAAGRPVAEVVGQIVGPSLLAVTLAMTPAVLGAVLYMAFGSRDGLSVLCALSLVGLGLLRPRLEEWQEIVAGAGSDANRSA